MLFNRICDWPAKPLTGPTAAARKRSISKHRQLGMKSFQSRHKTRSAWATISPAHRQVDELGRIHQTFAKLSTLRRRIQELARQLKSCLSSESSSQPTVFEAADPFAAGLFPICIATHDTGVRLLFDLATLLSVLDCRPGDRVLDLGAGAGFASEMLARFGYHVVALDPDRTALGQNRSRLQYDRFRIQGDLRAVQAVAEGLPFASASFDGIVGMNVMHHVRDLPSAVAELARVLNPGCRAVFSEPGLDHLMAPQTQRAVSELGENDQAFDVVEFLRLAEVGGFAETSLPATLHPPLRLVGLKDLELFASGHHHNRALTPGGVLEILRHWHPFAVLVREGSRPRTSRHPGELRSDLHVAGLPESARAGEVLCATVQLRNTGDTVWLTKPTAYGGYIRLGAKILTTEGRLISDREGGTTLPYDVPPTDTLTVRMAIRLPASLSPGVYRIQIDLVNELVCWFSDARPETAISHSVRIWSA